jgi:hypothetical protein
MGFRNSPPKPTMTRKDKAEAQAIDVNKRELKQNRATAHSPKTIKAARQKSDSIEKQQSLKKKRKRKVLQN